MDRQARTTKCDLEDMLFDESMEAKALPLSLLDCITNGFSDNQQIGSGGFAVVYKGLLENGSVAVKKLSQTSDIDEREFHAEVDCLMKAKHKNIVRFLGYCSDTQGHMVKYNGKLVMADVRQRLLCFEYLPNGSLDKYIKDSSREWTKCYQIIKGVCEGLHYLHKERIVHSDLKPANILLDNDLMPKIADFGLSRCFDGEQTHAFTSNLIGSWGYLAPEFLNGKISFKSDIYSLGVIIIEILTGKKGYKPVVEDVLEYWRHKVDKSQEKQQLEQIRVCTEVSNRCLKNNPEKRLCAQGIIDILEQTGSNSHMENKNKSNSLTAPQASLVMENNNDCNSSTVAPEIIPIKKRIFKMEAFKKRTPLDPETVAKTCKAVTQAICEFYAQGDANMSRVHLYRDAHDVVVHKKGEELYSAVETTMTSEVQSLCRLLEDAASADGAAFLKEMLAKWNQHIKAVKMTCDILMYMDLTFVQTNRKTPIYELGLRLWLDHMIGSDKIRERLVIEAVKRCCGDGGGEDGLVDGVNKMLMEIGKDVPGFSFQKVGCM